MAVGEGNRETEVLVIGAGPGGYAAAFRAADLGMEVTLVDTEKRPGGECLFRGCIPSKTLLYMAELLHDAQRFGEMGIKFDKPQIDLNRIRNWKNQVIDKLTNGLLTLSRRRKIQFLQGKAIFEGSDRVRLEGPESSQIHFRHAILATGSYSTPFRDIPFAKGSPIIDSAGALELSDIPQSLLVLGGGYVGLEMGTVYAALGSRVTVAVRGDRLLRGADSDLVDVLIFRLREIFEGIHFNTRVVSLKESDGGVDVKFEGGVDRTEQSFDRVLIAVGRKPNTENVGLEKTKVKLNEQGFVVVDEQRRTTDEKIFAIGDVAGAPLLAHKAFREGKVAAEVIKGKASGFDVQAIPAVVYTNPQVAWTGLTEEQARKQNHNIKVEKYLWKFSSRANTMGVSDGVTKMIFNSESGRLLGVGICGPNAEGMISEGTLAIEMGAVAQDLGLTIHPHPTLSEMMMETAELFTGTVTHVLPEKRLGSEWKNARAMPHWNVGKVWRSGENASENLIWWTFILQTHREGLDRVAKELVEKEEISGKEVLELVGVEQSKSSLIRSETLESPLHLPLRDDSLCPKPLCLGFIEYSSERRPEEAIPVIQKAIRISPSAHYWYASLGAALRMTGRFEEAVSAFKKAIQLEPDNVGSHIELAATYSLMGREKEAHAEAAEVLGINPKFSLDSYAKMVTYKNQSEADKLIDALRKAGLKGAIEAKFSAICTFLPVIVDPQRHLRL